MWQFLGTPHDEQNYVIAGINVWAFKWRSVSGEVAVVEDPSYGQTFRFPVYTVTDGEKTTKFAAGEFSNGIWGFYIPYENCDK